MSFGFPFFYFSSCYLRFLLVAVIFQLCLCYQNPNDDVLCRDDERQALFEFKHGLEDRANRLASWVGEKTECCNWTGIVCDNVTGHVHKIHLPGSCRIDNFNTVKEYEDYSNQRLGGELSQSLLKLKQLKHLDLSCNSFGEMEIPSFVGSLRNLRYLNLSRSWFGGSIPPQLGNLLELRTLCLGSFYEDDTDEYESTSTRNMQWLSGLRFLHHLDMSLVDLSEASDWIQVINTLPSLVELHLSNCQLPYTHPFVSNVNHTSLSLLDLSRNHFNNSYVLQWIFSISSLVSLDLSGCGFISPIPNSIDSFRNLTSLELLYVSGNDFMSSPFVLEGLSSVGSNLVSLDIRYCSVSSLVLGSLHNLTSLLSLDLSGNELDNPIPSSLGNFCNLRHLGLRGNSYTDISLISLLENFFKCNSPRLESLSLEFSGISSHLPNQLGKLAYLENLQLGNNRISGIIPDSLGQLSVLKSLYLANNLISGPIPYSIGGLLSLEVVDFSYNQLNGSLPVSLGKLSKLNYIDFSYNFMTGILTDSHFAKLAGLKFLNGRGNYLTLRPQLANWIPPFQLQFLYLSSWKLGPQFPSWLQLQRDLIELEISDTGISTMIPEPFWRSLPNIVYLNMTRNQLQGRLFGIPQSLQILDLSSNKFNGLLPQLSNSSEEIILDLSNNSFTGSLSHFLCSYSEKSLQVLNLANNQLSGIIPECWEKWPSLSFLNLENNNLSGGIPRSLGTLSFLGSLNMGKNKLSGRLPSSLKNLRNLKILQLAGNKLVGQIPTWLGRELASLAILNIRSNNFDGSLTDELCYFTAIQILDLSHNNLSGNIPKCFTNFTLFSGKETTPADRFIFSYNSHIIGSVSLVIKGREDTYNTILGLVIMLDLSSNNFSGGIPDEIMALQALQSLNLSRNQLSGRIPEKIGDMKSLSSFDISFNRLSGELPMSLSSLNFLSSFNVSYNNLTGRVPSGTQLQSFNESSFFGNKLCGVPLSEQCAVDVPNRDQEQINESDGKDWGLIISTMSGFVTGFWIVLAPLIVSRSWRTTYFRVLSKLWCMLRYVFHMYC